MSWRVPVGVQHSAPTLTPEQLTAGMASPPATPAHEPRPWLTARISACRGCEHVARGGQTCAACDLRCVHPASAERPPLLAEPAATCPAHLWPLSPP